MFQINVNEKQERVNYIDIQEDTVLNDLDRDQNLLGLSLILDEFTILNCKSLNNQLCLRETSLLDIFSKDFQLILTFVNPIKAYKILKYFDSFYICTLTNSSVYLLKISNSKNSYLNGESSRLLSINQKNYKDNLFVYPLKLQHFITKNERVLHVSILQNNASVIFLLSFTYGIIFHIEFINLLPSMSKDDIKVDIKEITSTSLMKRFISGIFMFEGPTKDSGYIGLEVLKAEDGLLFICALNQNLCLLTWIMKDSKVMGHTQIDVCELFDFNIDVNTILIPKISMKSLNQTHLIINFPSTDPDNLLLILKISSQACDYTRNKLSQDIFDNFVCEYPSYVELVDLKIVKDCIWLCGINTRKGNLITMFKSIKNGCLTWQMITMEESIIQLPTSMKLESAEWDEYRILTLIFDMYTFSRTDIIRSISILLSLYPLSENLFGQESILKYSKQQLKNLFEEEFEARSGSINFKEVFIALYSHLLNHKKESTRPLAMTKNSLSNISSDTIYILDTSMQGSVVCSIEPVFSESYCLPNKNHLNKIDTFIDMLVGENSQSEMSNKFVDYLSNGAYIEYAIPKTGEDFARVDPRKLATEMAECVLQQQTYEGVKRFFEDCFSTFENLSQTQQSLIKFIANNHPPVKGDNLMNCVATGETEDAAVPALDFVCKAFNLYLNAISTQTTRYLFFAVVVQELFMTYNIYHQRNQTGQMEPNSTTERLKQVEDLICNLSTLSLCLNSMLWLSGQSFLLLRDHMSIIQSVNEQLNKMDANRSGCAFSTTSLLENVSKLISSDLSEYAICHLFLKIGLEDFSLPFPSTSVTESEQSNLESPARCCGCNLTPSIELLKTVFWPSKYTETHNTDLNVVERTMGGDTLSFNFAASNAKDEEKAQHLPYHLIQFMLRTAQFSALVHYLGYCEALDVLPMATIKFIRAICYLNMFYLGRALARPASEGSRDRYIKLFVEAAVYVPGDSFMTTPDYHPPQAKSPWAGMVRKEFQKIDYYMKVISLLDHFGDQEGVLVIADLALESAETVDRELLQNEIQNSNDSSKGDEISALTQEQCRYSSTLWLLKFQASLMIGHYDKAYEAIFKNPQANRRMDCLRKYLNHFYEKGDFLTIVLQPYNELYGEASAVLLDKLRSIDSSDDALYQKSSHLLFAFYTIHDKTFHGIKIMLELALEYERRLPNLFDSNNASGSEITYEESINSLTIARALLVVLSALKRDKTSWVAVKNGKMNEENSDLDMENDEGDIDTPKFNLNDDVRIYKSEDIEKDYLMVTSILKLEQFKPYTLDSLSKPLNVANIVERLIYYGFFDDAFRLAQFDATNAQSDLIGSIFSRLASVCCALDTYGPARTKKLFDNNMTWQWLENKSALYNPYASADELNENSSLPARDFSMSERAWLVTKRYLHLYDQSSIKNGLRCLTEEMLSLGQTLPLWITKDYCETKRGQCELLRLFLFYQRYDEAVKVACELIEFAKYQIEHALGKRDKVIPDSWLPLSSIEFLIDVLDKHQDNIKLYQRRQQLTDNFESFLTQRQQYYRKGIKY